MTKYVMYRRCLVLINTDPQRRCYNGCHAKSELVWSSWERFDSGLDKATADRRLEYWRSLNEYAVSQRGETAKCEFKIEEGL